MRRYASLRRRRDFARLRAHGRRSATAHLTVFRDDAAPADDRPLVGISVSKAVGKAVVRNRVRRRLGACIQDMLIGHAIRMRLLIVARPSAAGASYAVLRAQVRKALR